MSACSPAAPAPEPSTASAAPNPSATRTSSPTPAAPALVPDGTAAENLPYFRQIVDGVWNGPDQVAGRAYIDALVAGGFARAAMQVTPDTSTIGNAAESIEFSVRWGDECLLGQVGPVIGAAVTMVAPGLADGGCLLGTTRAIDW
jgi:hypothetical protein